MLVENSCIWQWVNHSWESARSCQVLYKGFTAYNLMWKHWTCPREIKKTFKTRNVLLCLEPRSKTFELIHSFNTSECVQNIKRERWVCFLLDETSTWLTLEQYVCFAFKLYSIDIVFGGHRLGFTIGLINFIKGIIGIS